MVSMDYNRYKHNHHKTTKGNTDGFILSPPAQRPQPLPQPDVHITPDKPVVVEQPKFIPVQAPEAPPKVAPIAALPVEPNNWPNSASPKRFDRKKLKKQKPKSKKSTTKKIILRSFIIVILLVFGVGGYLGFRGLSTVNKVFHGNIISDAKAAFDSTPLKGESAGRVNILLAGDSADDPGHAGAQLTDSILLLSIDTQNHTAFLLSIPRDLWVYVPGMSSYQKINAANSVTNFSASGYPSGGMGELEQIIETQLGIPIDYYGLMDYGAFKDSVDAVGGVTITVNSPDPRGLYDPNTSTKLPNGPVTLTGQEALNLARARGDGYGSYGFPNSDFDRTEHQRQLFVAVASKAKSLGVLSNPVKVSDLFSAFGNNFQTDLSLQNVLRLIQVTKSINLNSLQSYAFSSTLSGSTNPLLENYVDPASGEDALAPTAGTGNYGGLEQYYEQLTSNNPVVKEAPSVVILNGSNVDGLASKERTLLESDGFNVTAVADANNEYPSTMVINTVGATKPNSLKLLQKLFPGQTAVGDTTPAEATEAQGYTSDFVVVLGQNWQTSSSSSTSQTQNQ
jgi:LCP family protein required for cell wall assembly